MNNVLWYLGRLQRSCCSAADLLLILSLSCGFAHGDPKHPPISLPFPFPPIINSLPHTLNSEANLNCPHTYVLPTFSIVIMSIWLFSALCFRPRFPMGKTLRHHPHYHVVEPCMASVLFGVCCFMEPDGGRLVLACSPPQGEMQKPIRTPGVCPYPLPGRLSLWCILALGNIDLNALCFDLNQLLPAYLYR